MVKNKRLELFIWCYPIVLTFIGVIIHLVGVLGFQVYLTANYTAHLLMLIIDTLVVIGLSKKMRWGYWLAVALYCQQAIFQPYWAYITFTNFGVPWLQVGAILFIIVSLFMLLKFKKFFVPNIKVV